MSSRARAKMRRSRPIHVERTPVRIAFKIADGTEVVAQARVVLSELTVDGVVLYSAEPLAPNTEVKLTIENPEKFNIEAQIVWCQYQDSSARILTQNAFGYRMGVAFRWVNDEDKNRFDVFAKTAKHHYDSVVNPIPKTDSEVIAGAPKDAAALDSAIDAAKLAAAAKVVDPTAPIDAAATATPASTPADASVKPADPAAKTESVVQTPVAKAA